MSRDGATQAAVESAAPTPAAATAREMVWLARLPALGISGGWELELNPRNGVLNVRRTLSGGEVVDLAKTDRSRRQVPLRRRALDALDAIPPRLDTPLLFPAVRGGVLNTDNFRRREWTPAVEASGVARPARIYDMRATYASESIAAGIGSDELARVMGTRVAMIEEHYGVLLGGAVAGIAARQDAYDDEQNRAKERAADEGV